MKSTKISLLAFSFVFIATINAQEIPRVKVSEQKIAKKSVVASKKQTEVQPAAKTIQPVRVRKQVITREAQDLKLD